MLFSKLLRTTILGLISVCGGLILVGVAAWLHYWLYGSLNPEQVMPLEDWSLTLGIASFLLQVAASIEGLIISVGIRFRWIKFNRGRLAVGLFSLIPLAYMIGGVWRAISNPYINLLWVVLYELAIMLPLGIAWFLLRFQRVEPSST